MWRIKMPPASLMNVKNDTSTCVYVCFASIKFKFHAKFVSPSLISCSVLMIPMWGRGCFSVS